MRAVGGAVVAGAKAPRRRIRVRHEVTAIIAVERAVAP